MISVLILTYNEEVNIKECIQSVSFSDDILVFDSFSTDKTRELAIQAGARVLCRTFDDYGSQRQAALEQGNFKHPWLLVLDADERVDGELASELKEMSADIYCPYVGFRIRRKDHFLKKWIPRATLYPTWFLHFFKHQKTHYEPRAVHEHPIVDGRVGELKGHLLHYSFSKGLGKWLEKHRSYAKLEAMEGLVMRQSPMDWVGLLTKDPGRRRRALKALSYRLPFRGLARLFYMVFARLVFLDGWAGMRYSLMICRYENWIQKEMNSLISEKSKGLTGNRGKSLKIFGFIFILLIFLQIIYFYSLLNLKPGIFAKSDSVLVYGGGITRTVQGLALAQKANLPIFISDTFGGPKDVQQKLGPVTIAITVDHYARTTDQNARHAADFLRNGKFHMALLVTDWYHMPRALFLTRLYLLGSGISVEPHFFQPVPSRWEFDSDFLLEFVRFWGSLGRVGLAAFGFQKPWFHGKWI